MTQIEAALRYRQQILFILRIIYRLAKGNSLTELLWEHISFQSTRNWEQQIFKPSPQDLICDHSLTGSRSYGRCCHPVVVTEHFPVWVRSVFIWVNSIIQPIIIWWHTLEKRSAQPQLTYEQEPTDSMGPTRKWKPWAHRSKRQLAGSSQVCLHRPHQCYHPSSGCAGRCRKHKSSWTKATLN